MPHSRLVIKVFFGKLHNSQFHTQYNKNTREQAGAINWETPRQCTSLGKMRKITKKCKNSDRSELLISDLRVAIECTVSGLIFSEFQGVTFTKKSLRTCMLVRQEVEMRGTVSIGVPWFLRDVWQWTFCPQWPYQTRSCTRLWSHVGKEVNVICYLI